jgi:N,N'-diacetyllegionaminate synthase
MPDTPAIRIGDRRVGPAEPPFIVAEVGINHNGDVGRALEMIEVARDAGCDAVKFQTFRASEFVNDASQMFTYRSQGREVTESMLEMFKRYEFPRSAWAEIKTACDKAGIMFFSSPQNRSDLDVLLEVGVPVIKVGSDDFTNLPLLKSYATTGLPLILSSGMSDLAEAHSALATVGAFDGYPTALLLCTSQYPTPVEDANLARIPTLRSAFPMVPIGFSDHSQGPLAAALATALGACIFEKHFTLSHDLPGPDHWFAEEPGALREWVMTVRTARALIGSPIVRPSATERENKREYQRRLVAARDIQQGEMLDGEAVMLRRVAGGRGFPPAFIDYVVGKPAPRAYRAGDPIEL